MTVSLRIDHDFKCLQTYFDKLLTLKDQLETEEKAFEPVAYDGDALEYPGTQFHASHLVKPDIIMGIYGGFEFWIQQLCEQQRILRNLPLSFRDIKGRNDLDSYHKYLARVAGLQLDEVQPSYRRLHDLRLVRNKLIHRGGHILDSEQNDFGQIPGISTAGSLLVISEEFIWDVLSNAKKYLIHVANTQQATRSVSSHP